MHCREEKEVASELQKQMEELKLREEEVQLLKQGGWSNYAVIINCVVHTLYSWDLMRDANLCFELPLNLTCKHVFLCILGSGKCIVSTLCFRNLEMGQHFLWTTIHIHFSRVYVYKCMQNTFLRHICASWCISDKSKCEGNVINNQSRENSGILLSTWHSFYNWIQESVI